MGAGFNPKRFAPYVAMYESEALLFSDCEGLARGMQRPDLADRFQRIRNAFASPEEIDDSPNTATSKRIEELAPGYQKPSLGILAALEIGLPAIREACPHFRSWLEGRERLTAGGGGIAQSAIAVESRPTRPLNQQPRTPQPAGHTKPVAEGLQAFR